MRTNFFKYEPNVLAEIVRHLESCYPAEGCGMLVQVPGGPLEVFAMRNVAADPSEGHRVHSDRGAETMFIPDPKDLYRVNMMEYDRGAKIVGIFHSHPEHDAYFSATDKAWSAPDGVESYPDAEYLVVSIRSGKAVAAAAFRFDPQSRSFIEASVALPASP